MLQRAQPTFGERYGPWAVVTGASAGLGAEFARQLAARGLHVVLAARRAERLTALAAELEAAHSVQTRSIPVDLATADGPARLVAAVADLDVGLLVNNAGASRTAYFLDDDAQPQVDLLQLNCGAPLALTHALARPMRARGRGGVLFVSSIVAYSPTPRWANYAAGKAYLRHLGEALAVELRPSGVDVLVVCPGTTATEFLQTAELRGRWAAMSAERVAAIALRALGRRTTVVAGRLNRLLTLSAGLVPRSWSVRLAGLILTLLERY